MKVAVVYNRESKRVINLFGMPNQEKIGRAAIQRIVDALKKDRHQVKTFEGDKDLIDNLEEFMPQVVKGERPGMVFNVSYGIQGQARYTHIPSILEMVGVPYVGSGPLAHSLSLDKVVTKMMLRQHGLPTPEFAVLDSPGFAIPDLPYPLIVKPKNEAVSFGISIVCNEDELRKAAQLIFDKFRQPVLVEQYIDGREINVGLIGNSPPEAFPPCEILFGENGPKVYSYEDKTGRSGRNIGVQCPADLTPEQTEEAKRLAIAAFKTLNCYDCARVDMRLDAEGNLYILEINSLPSMGEHGSYVHGAEVVGLDFPKLVNRLVEVASARYFGTPSPPAMPDKKGGRMTSLFNFITRNRDRMEKALQKWVRLSSRSSDYVGIWNVAKKMGDFLAEMNFSPVDEMTDEHNVWTWQTKPGYEGGILLIAHIDVPLTEQFPQAAFHLEPEWMYGEGVAASRGPLAVLEFSLRSLHNIRLLSRRKLGVLIYGDEGQECRHSAALIRRAAASAARVIVLRPAMTDCSITTDRRGQRFYRFSAEGKPNRIDSWLKKEDVLRWASNRLADFGNLSIGEKRFNIGALKLETSSFPMHLPHYVKATVLMSYASGSLADQIEKDIRQKLSGRHPFRCEFTKLVERPPLKHRKQNHQFMKELKEIAEQWEINLCEHSSAWPSVAGLVPASVPVVCGLGPFSKDLYTPKEAVNRLSLVQRCLLLASYISERG